MTASSAVVLCLAGAVAAAVAFANTDYNTALRPGWTTPVFWAGVAAFLAGFGLLVYLSVSALL